MKIEQESLDGLRDNLIETHKQISSLKDMTDVLKHGFIAINDDNIKYSVSSLSIIEKQLDVLENRLLKDLTTLDIMLEPKEV